MLAFSMATVNLVILLSSTLICLPIISQEVGSGTTSGSGRYKRYNVKQLTMFTKKARLNALHTNIGL